MRIRILRWATTVLIVLVLIAASGALYEQVSSMRDARRYPPPGTLIDIGNRRIHLLCKGNGTPTILLIPSGLGTVLQYTDVQQQLAPSFRVCAIDRAGFGWSDPADAPLTAINMEHDLEVVIDKARLPSPYILVASSAGGLTADLFIRKHPQQVAGIVWVDALTAEMVSELPALNRLEDAACTARDASWFGVPRLFDPLHILDSNDANARLSAALTYRHSTFSAACSLTKNFPISAAEIQSAAKRSSSIHAAVLVHGIPTGLYPNASAQELAEFDKVWFRLQHHLADSFTDHSFEIVTGSGHLIASERPDVVVRAVKSLSQPPQL